MRRSGWAVCGILAGMITLAAAGLALGQEQDFVGQPGSVGSFERFDPVLNDDVMNGVIPSGQDWYLFGQPERRGVYGWIEGGFIGNFASPASKFNGPYNAVDRANEPMMNQAYFIAEQTLPSDGSAGIGARADLLYGEDFPLAMSLGWETNPGSRDWNSGEYYGVAIPQLYSEVGTQDFNLKLGHFYSLVGYEGVPAEFYGAEAEAVFHLVDSEKQKLHLDLRLDRLEARDRSTGAPLPRISPMRFGGGLGYDRGPFGARIDVLHHEAQDRLAAGELATDGYTMVDTTVTYRFAWSGVQFDLMARGVNLLDQEARNHVSFLKDIAPLGGRGATVSLRASF